MQNNKAPIMLTDNHEIYLLKKDKEWRMTIQTISGTGILIQAVSIGCVLSCLDTNTLKGGELQKIVRRIGLNSHLI